MRLKDRSVHAIALTILLVGLARAEEANPAARPVESAQPASDDKKASTSSVGGTIASESEVPLSEMVVYLESPDADRKLPVAPGPVTVSQKGAQFNPRLVVVTVGQAVNFLNDEDRPIEHNVFSNSPAKRFDLGLYGPSKSKSVTFDKPGPVFLYCSIHRQMDGVIFVSPTPYTSLVNKDGHYEMKNVPPGNWTVKTWQRRRRFPEQTMPVAVETDKPATVDLELKRK